MSDMWNAPTSFNDTRGRLSARAGTGLLGGRAQRTHRLDAALGAHVGKDAARFCAQVIGTNGEAIEHDEWKQNKWVTSENDGNEPSMSIPKMPI